GEVYRCWQHRGFHEHPYPPGGRLNAADDELLDETVSRNPQASAHQLRIGTSLPGSRPLAGIHPTLADPRTARYQLSKSQSRLGITNPAAVRGVAGSFEALLEIQKKLEGPFLIDSGFHGDAVFAVLQTPWMATQLRTSATCTTALRVSEAASTRHGYVTDGDHSFFSHGVLLASCTFSDEMESWIPVLYTWILKQTTEGHRPHFRNLLGQIIQGIKQDGRVDVAPQDLVNVMDFSAAQREAFVLEYANACISMIGATWERLSDGIRAAEMERFREEAEKALQGCEVHFRRSALRISKQAFVIPPERKAEFTTLIEKLLWKGISTDEHNHIMETLEREFPKIKNWIGWWKRPAFAMMIFPACKTMDRDLEAQIPHTSNAIEGQHSLLHHGTGTDHDLTTGIERLHSYVKEFESRHSSIQGGHIDPPPPQRDSRPRRTAAPKFDANDGRAPDTIEALGLDQRNRSVEALLRSPCALQSYGWSDNSCFIDHTLEVLFWTVAAFSKEDRAALLGATPHDSALSSILFHFQRRIDILSKPVNEQQQRALERGLLMAPRVVRNNVDNIWKLYDPEEGRHGGSSTQWLDRAITGEPGTGKGCMPPATQAFFLHGAETHWVCPNGHKTSISERSHLILVLPPAVRRSIQTLLGKSEIDTQDFFANFVPCRHHATPFYLPFHNLPAQPCHSEGCQSQLAVTSVTYLWPNILFVRAESYGDNDVPATRADRVEIKTQLVVVGEDGAPVTYQLVGRILHQAFGSTGVQGHFTCELLLDGKSYTYDYTSQQGFASASHLAPC
ncbi:hypothetical protein BKA70DRAFT_1527968, partial [Coprinopsis sp. MPI-PUGE-AT-0042]